MRKYMHVLAVLPVTLSLIVIMCASRQAVAEEVRVAVASNFANAMRTLSVRFEASTGHKVTTISGSTGKHYAQIRNGAPFDAFFAADIKRPELLEKEGIKLSDFECKRMPELKSEGVKRKGFIKPEGFSIEEMDNGLEVSFYLPKGVYATVLLRSLFLG